MLIVKIRFKSAGIAFALGSVANIGITIGCRVGYFLQKIGYFLHFRPFRAFFGGANVKIRGKCGKLHALSCFTRCDVVKNSAASNFYEMRRNLNFMARSFREMPARFSGQIYAGQKGKVWQILPTFTYPNAGAWRRAILV